MEQNQLNKIFNELKGEKSINSWIEFEENYGIAWHMTDVKNMSNILSKQLIFSRNKAQEAKVMKNENSSISVNMDNSKGWVHDYARFYLRPKTPTQYRNEGIFPKLELGERGCERLYRDEDFWSETLAHLPVPVFVGFSLNDLLNHDAKITKGSLAGKKNVTVYEQMIDDDKLSWFTKNIKDIYLSKRNDINHTEVIVRDAFSFTFDDIKKIIVRNETEKLVLLTYIKEFQKLHCSTKEDFEKLNIEKIIGKIFVDRNFYFFGEGAGRLSITQQGLLSVESISEKKVSRSLQQVTNEQNNNYLLQKLTLEDVNGEFIEIGQLYMPHWLLKYKVYKNKRVYLEVYLDNMVYEIYRVIEQKEYYLKKTNELFKLLTAEHIEEIQKIENNEVQMLRE